MDIIDQVTYDFPEHLENNAEATRQAFVNVFNPSNDNALLVAKYLCDVLLWDNTYTCADSVFNSQAVALKNVMTGIKKQLNQKPIVNQPNMEMEIDE